MLYRIREAWKSTGNDASFSNAVGVNETYMGGNRCNIRVPKRTFGTVRGAVSKTVIAGMEDQTRNHVQGCVVENTNSETMSRFISENVKHGTKIYTD